MENLNPENIKVFSDGEWVQAKENVIKDNAGTRDLMSLKDKIE